MHGEIHFELVSVDGDEKMKLIFHLGLHRAASTSFQAWIAANREAWPRCFAISDLSSGNQGSAFGALVGRTLATAGPGNVALLLQEELEQRAADFDAGLLSNENILGMMPGQPVRTFASAGQVCEVLSVLAQSHTVSPAIILRDHLSWIASLYRIAQLRGELREFSEFAAHVLPKQNSYSHLLRRLSAAAAPGKPIVTTLEALARDNGQEFVSRIEVGLGVKTTGSSLPHKNSSPSLLACTIRQQAARREGVFVLEGDNQTVQLIHRLSSNPDQRTGMNCGLLEETIRCRTVRMADIKRFKVRLRKSRMKLREDPAGSVYLSAQQAKDILRDAFGNLKRPLLPIGELQALRQRFADDRNWVAGNFAPEWQQQNQEIPT